MIKLQVGKGRLNQVPELHLSILIAKHHLNVFNQWWILLKYEIQEEKVWMSDSFSLSVNMHGFPHSIIIIIIIISLPLSLGGVLSGGRSDVRAPPLRNAWIIAGVKWIWTCSQRWEGARVRPAHICSHRWEAAPEPRWVQEPPGISAEEVFMKSTAGPFGLKFTAWEGKGLFYDAFYPETLTMTWLTLVMLMHLVI